MKQAIGFLMQKYLDWKYNMKRILDFLMRKYLTWKYGIRVMTQEEENEWRLEEAKKMRTLKIEWK